MTFPSLHPAVLPAAWAQPEMLIPFGGLLVAFGGLLLATCQFLKSEIRDSETRLREEMKASEVRLREEMQTSEVRLREEMKVSEVRQREALSDVKGEIRMLKGELKGLGDKLDRVVESLLARQVLSPSPWWNHLGTTSADPHPAQARQGAHGTIQLHGPRKTLYNRFPRWPDNSAGVGEQVRERCGQEPVMPMAPMSAVPSRISS